MTNDRQDRVEAQLKAWAEGRPYHNEHDGECCPDFSCCSPELLAPPEVRQQFVEATDDGRVSMLGSFLTRMLENEGHTVHTSADVRREVSDEP